MERTRSTRPLVVRRAAAIVIDPLSGIRRKHKKKAYSHVTDIETRRLRQIIHSQVVEHICYICLVEPRPQFVLAEGRKLR